MQIILTQKEKRFVKAIIIIAAFVLLYVAFPDPQIH